MPRGEHQIILLFPSLFLYYSSLPAHAFKNHKIEARSASYLEVRLTVESRGKPSNESGNILNTSI